MSAPTYELNRLDLHANPQATLHESSLSPDIASLDQLFSELRARWDWLHSIFIVSLRHNHRNALDASGVQQVADEIEAFDNQLRSAALAVQNCGDGINDQLEMARSRVMNLRLQLSCMRREMVKLTLECLSCFAKGALSLLSITSMNLDLEHAVIDAVVSVISAVSHAAQVVKKWKLKRKLKKQLRVHKLTMVNWERGYEDIRALQKSLSEFIKILGHKTNPNDAIEYILRILNANLDPQRLQLPPTVTALPHTLELEARLSTSHASERT